MKTILKPIGDRIVVQPLEEKETLKNGLYIPDNAKERPMEGKVIAVGSGRRYKNEFLPLEVSVDDRILFGKYSGTEIKIDDKDYLILKEEEVLTILV